MNINKQYQDKFWIVANKEFPTQVTYKHISLESAEKEAQRLALNVEGEEFVILEALRSYVVNKLHESEFVLPENNPDHDLYIPF